MGEEKPGKRSHRKAWIALLAVAVILLALYVASEIVIPPVASSYVKREFEREFPEARNVKVSIAAFPALKMVFKRFSSFHLSAENVPIKGTLFQSLEVKSGGWPRALFEATISQEELNRTFAPGDRRISRSNIQLLEGVARVTGLFNTGTETVEFIADGVFSVSGRRSVFFVPTEIKLGGVSQPPNIVSMIRTVLEEVPAYTASEDGSFIMSKVVSRPGKLVTTGEVNLQEALELNI